MFVEIQKLEPRRLFAGNFEIVSVTGVPAKVQCGSPLALEVIVKNTTDQDHKAWFEVGVSTDIVPGNADDVIIGTMLETTKVSGGRQATISVALEVPGFLRARSYHMFVIAYAERGGSYQWSPSELGRWIAPDVTTRIIAAPVWPSRQVFATHGDDMVVYTDVGVRGGEFLSINGDRRLLPEYGELYVDLGWGNDRFVAEYAPVRYSFISANHSSPLTVKGFAGNDTIIGGYGHDSLVGGNGKDRLIGSYGDDILIGNAAADYLNGEEGDDLLFGNGGNDRLIDLAGKATLLGGAGNDVFITAVLPKSNSQATLSGGAGHDRAQAAEDDLAGIEELLSLSA